MKFKKFKKEGNKRKIFVVVAALFMVIGALFIGMSYAMYQTENEIAFINAKVADFRVFLSDITATSTNNSINLSYTASGLNAKATCAYGTTKGTYNIGATTVDNNKCTKTGLSEYTKYYYKVCAKNNLKQEECKEGEVATKHNPPILSEVTATSTENSITLSWDSSGYITTTMVYYALKSDYSDAKAFGCSDKHNCPLYNLPSNTMIYYIVAIHNDEIGVIEKRGSIKTKAKPIVDQVKIGDYISMTPSSTSYTISKDLTGYTRDQTINPSELNLWRVIKKNSDGTVEMVSEYVSSTAVYFGGDGGYLNLVGGLNTIAAQYTDGKHVLRTRHMGYSNQKEKCRGPLRNDYFGDCDSDMGYETDTNLVKSVVGSLVTKKVGTSTAGSYWLPSRKYELFGDTVYYGYKKVTNEGYIQENYIYTAGTDSGGYLEGENSLRPVVVLKSDTVISSGKGTSSLPYVLS